MKSLSIQQPWAWLIAKGLKPVENRTWSSAYRGPLLIHAGKKFDWEGLRWLKDNMPELTPKLIAHFGVRTFYKKMGCRDLGGIVGQVKMVDCVKAHPSPYFCGPFGFIFKHPILFNEPFQCKGKLGFFDVDENLLPEVYGEVGVDRQATLSYLIDESRS